MSDFFTPARIQSEMNRVNERLVSSMLYYRLVSISRVYNCHYKVL